MKLIETFDGFYFQASSKPQNFVELNRFSLWLLNAGGLRAELNGENSIHITEKGSEPKNSKKFHL